MNFKSFKNFKPPINYGPTKSVALFTNARDEKNIKEWAAHHLLIGFDKIIIFDHKSILPLKNVFINFDNRVTIIDAKHYEKNVKLTLMNIASNIAKNLKVDWFIYLDADEFLILSNQFIDVKHFLNHYSNAHSLGKAVNPHYYVIQNSNRMFGMNKRLNEPFCFNNINVNYSISPAYIAHYVNQSEETYLRRKVNLPTDDTGNFRNNDIKNIHNYHNSNENLFPKNKYSEIVKKFLESKV